jgi:hypothetical protein
VGAAVGLAVGAAVGLAVGAAVGLSDSITRFLNVRCNKGGRSSMRASCASIKYYHEVIMVSLVQ